MNERIRTLALEAGGGLSCIAEPLEHPWKFSESELEKFAELIVRECTEINKQELAFNAFERLLNRYQEHFEE